MQIALLGSTPSRKHAPYDDPSWAIWAHACLHGLAGMPGKRVDRWFDLHTPSVRNEPKSWCRNYPAWLAKADRAEIVLQAADASVPRSVGYPRAEVEAWARGKGILPERAYFTSSLSWMIALALYEGATRIGIWGCNFAQEQEYVIQRPCAEYWIGAARALGVPVDIAPSSPLTRSRHVYGYDGHRKELLRGNVTPVAIKVVPGGVPADQRTPLPPEIAALTEAQKELYGE